MGKRRHAAWDEDKISKLGAVELMQVWLLDDYRRLPKITGLGRRVNDHNAWRENEIPHQFAC